MRAGTKQPYKSVRKGNKMIFSTITQNNLNLTADTTEIPAQYSNNIQFKFIQDNERFSGYIPTIYIGVYDSAMIECGDVISAGGAVVVDGDGVFAISNEIMYRNGFLAVGVTLTNNDENVSLKPVIYRIQASVGGLSPLPPDEGEWQQVVKAFVETLFNNWSAENLDPIKAQLEELISTAQTQQEKITSQQTQIDNAIGNMGDYEIVQEDPVQIRFKKGDGTFGETVDLGDGLASKAMVNAGYYTYKDISYGGSASNNGIDVAEIDGAYNQVTTNGFQLFDASKLPTKTLNGVTMTNHGDGTFSFNGSSNSQIGFNFEYLYTHEQSVELLKVGALKISQFVSFQPYVFASYYLNDLYKGEINSEIDGTLNITQEMLNDPTFKIKIGFYVRTGLTASSATIKPMLYQDGDGTWEPFTGGQPSPNPEYKQEPKFTKIENFYTSGKNLLQPLSNTDGKTTNVLSVSITQNNLSFNLSGTVNGDGGRTNYFAKALLPAGKYYWSVIGDTTNINPYISNYKTNKPLYVSVGVITLTEETEIGFGFNFTNGKVVNITGLQIQIEFGEVATPYTPYVGSSTTPVSLELRALPDGTTDTYENGVITRRVGEITYDGSESWVKMNGSDSNNWLYARNQAQNKTEGLCDLLLHKSYAVINQGAELDNVGFNTDYYKGTLYLNVGYYMEQAGLTNTVDNLKTWLQSNPITVWYELATPTTEQITLPTLPSWYPYTNAWVGTELQPSFVEWHIKTAGVNQNDLTVIKEDISQLQTETMHLNDDVTKLMGAFTSVTDLTKQLFLLMHRVGDIIFSTSDENPSTIYGGTWVAWGKGQVPVGVDTSDSDFNTVEKTGGEKEHTLTVDEMPSHKHDFGQQFATTSNLSGTYGYYMIAGTQTDVIKNTGGNQPHNNLQPYITCYMWKRTA